MSDVTKYHLSQYVQYLFHVNCILKLICKLNRLDLLQVHVMQINYMIAVFQLKVL